jgi:quercetin dioxygenase-like cupin family protein
MASLITDQQRIPENKPFAEISINVFRDEGVLHIWHSHDGDQILIVIGGEGYYKEKAGEIRFLKHGDVVFIKAGVEHWHTAMFDCEFTHVVINGCAESEIVSWLQKRKD